MHSLVKQKLQKWIYTNQSIPTGCPRSCRNMHRIVLKRISGAVGLQYPKYITKRCGQSKLRQLIILKPGKGTTNYAFRRQQKCWRKMKRTSTQKHIYERRIYGRKPTRLREKKSFYYCFSQDTQGNRTFVSIPIGFLWFWYH